MTLTDAEILEHYPNAADAVKLSLSSGDGGGAMRTLDPRMINVETFSIVVKSLTNTYPRIAHQFQHDDFKRYMSGLLGAY